MKNPKSWVDIIELFFFNIFMETANLLMTVNQKKEIPTHLEIKQL